jgi:hypothetical protein
MASQHPLLGPNLTITCASCPVREQHCADCMVTALLDPGAVAGLADLPPDPDEQAALRALVGAGLLSREGARSARARRTPLRLRPAAAG